MSVTDRPDHTGTIHISGSVTIPVSIEASVVTFNVNIVGSTATLSVDIVASSVTFNAVVTASDIMMPVDIQAQYITLDINIAASAVTLNVNITASAVTLNVTIQSSAVTLNVNITASAVTLNVAIQSSAVTLNVNITASAVTLNVAIQSSAVTLNVNISSSSVTLNVTVTNATLNVTGSVTISGTANITITGQSVGVSIQGEWQVEQGNLKTYAGGGSLASGAQGYISYTVPAGKILYIYGATFCTRSYATGGDNPQEMSCELDLNATTIMVAIVGEAQQTVPLVFSTPFKAAAGIVVRMYSTNIGAASGTYLNSWWGYEKAA
jgi:hypothetical protein